MSTFDYGDMIPITPIIASPIARDRQSSSGGCRMQVAMVGHEAISQAGNAMRRSALGHQIAIQRITPQLPKQTLPPVAALGKMMRRVGTTMPERRAMVGGRRGGSCVQLVSCPRKDVPVRQDLTSDIVYDLFQKLIGFNIRVYHRAS